MGVPPVIIQVCLGSSIINHPASSSYWGSLIYGKPHIMYPSGPRRFSSWTAPRGPVCWGGSAGRRFLRLGFSQTVSSMQVCKSRSAVVSDAHRFEAKNHWKIIEQDHTSAKKERFQKCIELRFIAVFYACFSSAIPVPCCEQIGPQNPRPFWQLSPYFLTELPGQCGPTTAVASAKNQCGARST